MLCYDLLGCVQDLVLFQKRKLGKGAVRAQAHSDMWPLPISNSRKKFCALEFHDVASDCTLILLGQVS